MRALYCVAMLLALGLVMGPGTAEAQIWYKPGFPDLSPTWPNYLGAPSGMPDFDQHQNFDGNSDPSINPQERADGVDLYYCAPTAAANCLWWFGSVRGAVPTTYMGNTYQTRYPALADVNLDGAIDRRPNINAPDDAMALVQNLAHLMDTNDQRIVPGDGSPNMGTWVPANVPVFGIGTGDGFGPVGGYGLEPGLREYIQLRNVALEVRSVALPNFDHFQTELLSCNNIILTVANPADGGWIEEPRPVPGNQTGFHCITAAGVFCDTGGNPRLPQVAISDPWTDEAEKGFPGRVLPTGHGPPHPANSHNDPQNVSQDAYSVNIIAHPTAPGASTFQLANYLNQPNNHATVAWMTIVYPTASTPVSFSVAPNAQGIVPAQSLPNAVHALNAGGQPNQGEVFGSSTRRSLPGLMAGNNQTSLSGANLGLIPGEDIDGLSYGKDAGEVVYFSVNTNAQGMPNTAVNNESKLSNPNFALAIPNPQNPGGGAPGMEAAGDVFKAMAERGKTFGKYYRQMHLSPDDPSSRRIDQCWICSDAANPSHPLNRIFIDDAQLGLQAPGTSGAAPVPEDNLDAFEYAAANDPVWGVAPDPNGVPQLPVFFALNNSNRYNAQDILTSLNGNLPSIFANGLIDIGLQAGDDLDALALADVRLEGSLVSATPDGVLNPGFDEALFSLAPGSPSLYGPGGAALFSPGDIFYTDFNGAFSLWTSAGALGLVFTDNLDALDVAPVPEPSTLALLAFGAMGLVGWARLRRRR